MRHCALVAISRLNPLRPELTHGLSGADFCSRFFSFLASDSLWHGFFFGSANARSAPLRVVCRRRCLRA